MSDNEEQLAEESLTSHLEELRTRLIRIVYVLIGGFAICFTYSEILFDIVRKPIQPFLPQGGLVFTAPMDKFMAHIKVSLLASAIITSPLWLYQVWKFIAPGLYQKEKKYGISFIFFGSLLFTSGAVFVYMVVYPLAFEFLMNFGGLTDAPMITISEYIGFFILTTAVFGLMFELPLVLTILGMIGIVSQNFLKQQRRYAIVILAIMSAVVTPPDVVSQLCMMAPLILLYELSIILVGIFGKKSELNT